MELAPELNELNKIFEDATGPVFINSSFRLLKALTKKKQFLCKQSLQKATEYINRKILIEKIFAFAQIVNGLIVGGVVSW